MRLHNSNTGWDDSGIGGGQFFQGERGIGVSGGGGFLEILFCLGQVFVHAVAVAVAFTHA